MYYMWRLVTWTRTTEGATVAQCLPRVATVHVLYLPILKITFTSASFVLETEISQQKLLFKKQFSILFKMK